MKLYNLGVLLLILSLMQLNGYGQSTGLERLEGKPFNKYIKIYDSGGKQLKYTADTDVVNSSSPLSSSEKKPTILRAKEVNFNVIFDFFNPLKYSITISEDSKSDPEFETAGKFLEQLITLATLLNTGVNTEGTGSALKNALPGSGIDMLGISASTTQKNITLYTPVIANWYLWKSNLDTCRSLSTINQNSIDRHFTTSETYLHGSFSSKRGEEKEFVEHIRKAIEKMAITTSFDALSAAQVDAAQAYSDLDKMHKLAQEAVDAVKTTASSLPESINLTNNCDILRAYTRIEFLNYASSANNVLKARRKLLDEFKKLNDEVNGYTGRKGFEFVDKQGIRNVEIDRAKVKLLTIKLYEREITLTDQSISVINKKEPTEAYIEAVRYTKAIVELAGGSVYSNISYQKYGVNKDGSGNFVVADAGVEQPRVLLASFFNVVFNAKWGITHPMLQLGVGTGKEYPTLLLGGGLRFFQPKNVSLSAGWVLLAFQRRLTNYAIDSIVDGTAALESDYRYRPEVTPKFYVGFQVKF